ncbi:MAG: hypothetical protein J0H66_03615 [Solirubrobacterales bacterium]|nr:hypothetical protein [Solirubrobacterales bacterium]OJU96181.1 MAG: hypothetical protein BGO23_01280 [Solirubrobacterales bacterium 67-14]
MNVHANHGEPANVAARRLLCLAASILGLMVLAFGVAPGTVLASSASDIYTEDPGPATPNTNNGGNNGGASNNGGKPNSGENVSTGSEDPGSGYYDDGSSSGDDQGTSGEKQAKRKHKQADSKDKRGKKARGDDSDDTAVAATAAGGDDGDGGGGSALPVIIAILIGVPLIGAGGYYGWTRYRAGDDETKDRLKTALKGGKPTGTS